VTIPRDEREALGISSDNEIEFIKEKEWVNLKNDNPSILENSRNLKA
jgi:bifunctional DNA-binding transcriptional regulator/antitoxin component of YhaV-PrlF toxin-antitoxin module